LRFHVNFPGCNMGPNTSKHTNGSTILYEGSAIGGAQQDIEEC